MCFDVRTQGPRSLATMTERLSLSTLSARGYHCTLSSLRPLLFRSTSLRSTPTTFRFHFTSQYDRYDVDAQLSCRKGILSTFPMFPGMNEQTFLAFSREEISSTKRSTSDQYSTSDTYHDLYALRPLHFLHFPWTTLLDVSSIFHLRKVLAISTGFSPP